MLDMIPVCVENVVKLHCAVVLPCYPVDMDMDQSMVEPGWWNISIIATPSDIEFVGVCSVFCVLTQLQS